MSGRSNPYRLGEKVIFDPDDRTIGWTWSSFDRLRIRPGDMGIVARIVEGQYLFIDDDREGFDWECFKRAD